MDARLEVREAGPDDRETIAEMLGRAFLDDPVATFIEPDRAIREAANKYFFASLFDEDGQGMRLTTTGREAATLWHLPGKPVHMSLWQKIAGFWQLMRLPRDKARRIMAVQSALKEHRLPGDHLYLHIAGCDPDHQGKGLGRAVVQAGLDRQPGHSVFLETATEKNIRFYSGLGFAVVDEWTVPGGPVMWTMARPASG